MHPLHPHLRMASVNFLLSTVISLFLFVLAFIFMIAGAAYQQGIVYALGAGLNFTSWVYVVISFSVFAYSSIRSIYLDEELVLAAHAKRKRLRILERRVLDAPVSFRTILIPLIAAVVIAYAWQVM